jgi:hypothetical protein
VYHALVAAPIPLIVGVLAFRAHTPVVRVVLIAASIVLFVVLFWVSYFFLCVGCT